MYVKEIRLIRERMLELQRNLGGQLKSDAKCCGITVAQCHALMKVGAKGEISLVELAGSLGLDNSTLSRTIDVMVQAGLVERYANPHDRRYVTISLSTKGCALYNNIDRTSNEYFASALELIPEEKRGQILESFTLLEEAVSKLGSMDCCMEEVQGEG